MLKSRRRRETIKAQQGQQKLLAEALGEERALDPIGTASSRAPKPPVLFSIGDFALELDRMKLLEKKSEMIGSILSGADADSTDGEVAVESSVCDRDDMGDGRLVRGARARLERQLHQLHQKGIICKGTPLRHLKAKLVARKQRSEIRATHSMRW